MNGKKMGPLSADHPLVTGEQKGVDWEYDRCAGCQRRFAEGDVVTLVVIGPGDDPETREKARRRVAYNAIAVPAHWACVTGEEP